MDFRKALNICMRLAGDGCIKHVNARTGVAHHNLKNFLSGKTSPTLRTIETIAGGYGLSLSEFMHLGLDPVDTASLVNKMTEGYQHPKLKAPPKL